MTIGIYKSWERKRPSRRASYLPSYNGTRTMNRDRYDLPLTTGSDRAAAHYRDGVDCMLSAWHGAEDAFDKAIAEDPTFALAHIGRARLHQLNMEGAKARHRGAGP